MKTLAPELVEKIERRARKAFELLDQGSREHVTRISNVTATACSYRLPHETNRPLGSGHRLTVTRTTDGSIVIPLSTGPLVLDLLTKSDLAKVKDHNGLVRGYKYTDKDGQSPVQSTGKLKYEVGKDYEEKNADTSDKDCSHGINLASLDWCEKQVGTGNRIFAAEFEAPKDVASVPSGTDGKFRVFRCKIVDELPVSGGKATHKPPTQIPAPTVTLPPLPPGSRRTTPIQLPVIQKEEPAGGLSAAIRRLLGRKKKS